MFRRLVAVALVICSAAGLTAQTAKPTFEVASVKKNVSGKGAFAPPRFTATTVTAQNVPVDYLIQVAYGVAATELVGGPDWIHELSGERFDIAAKAPDGSSRQEQLAMLRHLLEERFALRVRRETRDMPVFLLTRLENTNQPGPNLKRAAKDCLPSPTCAGQTGRGAAAYKGAQWSEVLKAIAVPLDRRLIDRTALSGAFDFELTYARGLSVSPDDSSVDIYAAVRQQLGLKLEPGRAPLEVTVIDSVSKPTEN